MTPSIRIESLSKVYGDHFTLGPISEDLYPGVTCVVGANGAGKSTLFGLLAGLRKPSSGTVEISPTGTKLGVLPQDFVLPPRATCEQFLSYAAWIQKVATAHRGDAVDRILELVGLSDRASTRIGQLSGGMSKRLGIAQAIVHDPGVLILDEPTAGLDPVQRVAIRNLIGDIGKDRIVLVSTHLVEDIRGMADRVWVLNDGALLFDGGIPDLEAISDPDAPGDTTLERALSSLMIS